MFTNKELKNLIAPLIIERLLAVSVGIADIMMVSAAGETAVSGVSLVDMINVLIIDIFSAMATGGAVIASQYIGQKKADYARKSAEQLLFITLLISLVIMGLTLAGNRMLLGLLYGKIDTDVMDNAVIYMVILAFSYPFIALYQAGAALFRSMGNSKISMQLSVVMNVMNIAGNAVCVFLLRLGVAGVAIPSLVSRMFSAVVILMLLHHKKNLIYVESLFQIRPDRGMVKRILSIAVPSGLENSMFSLGRILVVSIITTFGTVQIAANAVANNIDAFGCIPGQAISLAMITVVGQCVGAGAFEEAKGYAKKLVWLTYGIGGLVNAAILLGLPFILKIYHLSEETMRLSYRLIMIHNGAAIFLWPVSFVLPNALRASNDVKFPMVVSIFSMFTFRIIFSYLIGIRMGFGAVGVWIAMCLDWMFRTICFILRFTKGKWCSHYRKSMSA